MIIEADEISPPVFVVVCNSAEKPVKSRIWKWQGTDMDYFAHIGGANITTNSTLSVAHLQATDDANVNEEQRRNLRLHR